MFGCMKTALGLLIAIGFCVSGFAKTATRTEPEQVRAFLNEHPVIRIGITEAPGAGHQSAGATLVTRLRQLGYQGTLQIVHHNQVRPQLEFLFPPFVALNGPFQDFPNLGLQFFEAEVFKRMHENNRVPLGIMGADDYELGPEFLNVDILLTLQPLLWNKAPILKIRGRDPEPLEDLQSLGYVFDLPSFHEPEEFLASEMSHTPDLSKKIPGLSLILNKKNPFEMAAIYGHYISRGWQLLSYLHGLVLAWDQKPAAFRGGILLPIFSELTPRERLEIYFRILKDNVLKKRVSYVKIEEPEMPDLLSRLHPGHILIVEVGAVSKRVFEHFYALSSLPPIVEGRNSINLMQLLGRPYLPSRKLESYHFQTDLEPINLPGGDLAFSAAEMIWSQDAHWNWRTDPLSNMPDLARFILAAKDPTSEIVELFANSREQLDPIKDDQVIQGILKLQEAYRRYSADPCTLQLQSIGNTSLVPAQGF